MKVRFAHADAGLGNLTIRVDENYIYDLAFGDVTPYQETTDFGRITVYKGDVVIMKKKVPHNEGVYTAVIAPKSDLVLYKDVKAQNEEGTSSLQFYHLGS